MSDRLKALVPKLTSLVTQLSKELTDCKQELVKALGSPPDQTEVDAAKQRAEAAEELNKSLSAQVESLKSQLEQEGAEDEDLASQIEPFLKPEKTGTPPPLEVEPPAKAKIANE